MAINTKADVHCVTATPGSSKLLSHSPRTLMSQSTQVRATSLNQGNPLDLLHWG